MKIDAVRANNRKRVFEVEIGAVSYAYPFALLAAAPGRDNRVLEVASDPDLGHEGFTYVLEDGTEDTIHVDAVLEYNEDPGYLNELLLHKLTLETQKAVEASDLSKREITRALGTSATQLYRLLDPTNHTKSVGQMLGLLHVLGREVEVVVTPRSRRNPKARKRRRRTSV